VADRGPAPARRLISCEVDTCGFQAGVPAIRAIESDKSVHMIEPHCLDQQRSSYRTPVRAFPSFRKNGFVER